MCYDLLFIPDGKFKPQYAKCPGNEVFIVFEKCSVMFTNPTHPGKGNFPFNLDNPLSIVQFPF